MASVSSSKEKGGGGGGSWPRWTQSKGFAAGFQGIGIAKPCNEGWLLYQSLMAKGRIAHLQLQGLTAEENNSSQGC